jgi:hypothetical protein
MKAKLYSRSSRPTSDFAKEEEGYESYYFLKCLNTQRRGRVVSTSASCSGGPGLKPRRGDRLQ